MNHHIVVIIIVDLLIFLVRQCVPTASGEEVEKTLFFTSPGNTGTSKGDGVESVSVSYHHGGEVQDGPYGFGCQRFGSDLVKNLRIKSMSFDPVSNQVLVQVSSKDDSRFTLARGLPCNSVFINDCSELNSSNGGMNSTFQLLYHDAKSLEYAKIGPFAYFDSRIFFLLQRFVKPDFRTKLNLIELREMLTVCVDGSQLRFPIRATNSIFELVECSQIVSTVIREKYDEVHTYRPLDSLIAVPSVSSDRLDFYFQLHRLTILTSISEPYDISVILFHASNDSNKAEALYERPVNPGYFKYVLLQLGGLSHHKRYLCWAAIDTVLCGKLDDRGRLVRIRTFLKPGQADHVCYAPLGSKGLRSVVTGVALATASENKEVVLYFGCVAQVRGIGGAGLLRMSENGVFPAHVTPLKRKEEFVFAGSMLLLDKCTTVVGAEVGRIESSYVMKQNVSSGLVLLVAVFVGIFFVVLTITC